MARPALRLIEGSPFFEDRGEFWSSDQSEHHSLHYSIPYPESFRPQIPSYFIKRYTKVGDTVLDPFSGRGTTAFEANLLGRRAFASDLNPLAMQITQAKLEPAELAAVALFLQSIDLRRPVSTANYREWFEPFFEINTFRELMNLRSTIRQDYCRVARFVEFLALSLLHGHTAGYLSVYTFPQVSLLPQAQRDLNDRRLQLPEHRAVVPRILRKAAMVLRDGRSAPVSVSDMDERRLENRFGLCDARNLSYVPSGSVDLVVTAPPRPNATASVNELWLKNWFIGVTGEIANSLAQELQPAENLQSWRHFMNETLLELARVVRKGGRAVFDLRELIPNQKSVDIKGSNQTRLEHELVSLVTEELSMFWEPDCVVINEQRDPLPRANVSAAAARRPSASHRVLVLRRRS